MNTDDFVDALDGCFSASALTVAMERGLFWELEDGPLTTTQIATRLGFDPTRSQYWLQVLESSGYIMSKNEAWCLTDTTQSKVVKRYSRESWAMLAILARHRQPALMNLADAMKENGSEIESIGLLPSQIASEPDMAAQFTHMLYEFHLDFADCIADTVDLRGVRTLVDLGGGSGVVSMAMARKNAELSATVVELDHVCAAGRNIAVQNGLEDRIEYRELNILQNELPSGTDLFIECDVGIYSEDLFKRIGRAMSPDGRYVVVDKLAPAPGVAPSSRAHWALLRSLVSPGFSYLTRDEIVDMASASSLSLAAWQPLCVAADDTLRFSEGFTVLEFTHRDRS